MRKPYTERRGETQIFGYINESGEKVPIRSWPAAFMDGVRTRMQLMHIEEEYCQIHEKHGKHGKQIKQLGDKLALDVLKLNPPSS